MPAVAHDDVIQFHWVPSVANVAAPTVAEITAGDRILGITNYTLPSSEATVDTSDIDGKYDTTVVGTSSAGPIELTIKRDDTTETAGWELFTFRENGVLVVLPFGGSGVAGAPAATDKAYVYPGQAGQKRPEGYSRNTTQKFMVAIHVRDEPDVDAVVSA